MYFLLILIHFAKTSVCILAHNGKYSILFLFCLKSILLVFSYENKEKPWDDESSFESIRQNDLFHFSGKYKFIYIWVPCIWISNYLPHFHFQEFLRQTIYSLSLAYLCKLLVIVLYHLGTFLMELFIVCSIVYSLLSLICIWKPLLVFAYEYFILKWLKRLKWWNRDWFFFWKSMWSIDCWTNTSIVCVCFVLILMDST